MLKSLFDKLLGGIFGQIGEKAGSWIPDKDQRYRQKLKNFNEERDELLNPKNGGLDARKLRRLNIIDNELHKIKNYLQTR